MRHRTSRTRTARLRRGQFSGSASVTATVTNLWQARQILLRYGDACVVTEPSELVALFRATARGLSALYADSHMDQG